MEHIRDILKETRTGTSKANTDTSSSADTNRLTISSPACPLCKGAGFIHPRGRDNKADFSRVVPCRCTREKAAGAQRSRDQADCGLSKLHRTMTFQSFQKRINLSPEEQENLKKAYDEAVYFAKNPEEYGWLLFMGETGCGKTHLAAAIANRCLENGRPVLFVSVPEFLDHLRSTFNPESAVSFDELFERVKKAPILILDDFGEHDTTPWAKEKLYQVINYRYTERLPTIVTTSYSGDQLFERITPSVASRLDDPKISLAFNIIAPDYRRDSRARRLGR